MNFYWLITVDRDTWSCVPKAVEDLHALSCCREKSSTAYANRMQMCEDIDPLSQLNS